MVFYIFDSGFLCGVITKSRRHARTAQLVSQQSLASIINKKQKQNCGQYEQRHCGIDIPGYTFGSMIEGRAIPPPSGGSAPRGLQAIYILQRLSRLQLYSKGAYFHHLIIFSKLRQKGVIFYEIYPVCCGVYLFSDICRMRLFDQPQSKG